MAVGGLVAGFVAGWLAAPWVESHLIPESWPGWFEHPVRIAIWTGTPLSGMMVGLALALLAQVVRKGAGRDAKGRGARPGWLDRVEATGQIEDKDRTDHLEQHVEACAAAVARGSARTKKGPR